MIIKLDFTKLYITVDALLHIPLQLAFFVVCTVPFLVLPWILAGTVVSSWMIYYREVVQAQAAAGNDFRTGWNFMHWSTDKNIETWFPIGTVVLLGAILQYVIY